MKLLKYFSKEENNFIIDTKELVNAINSGNYGLSIICNPNNPTGFAFSRDEIEYILKNTNCYIMIDETYIEFTDTAMYSCTSLVDKYNKLFVIREHQNSFQLLESDLDMDLLETKRLKMK